MTASPANESLRSAIATLCDGLQIDAEPSQVDRLARYANLLERWNSTYNLTAVRGLDAILTHHLADCLAVVHPLRRRLTDGRVLDVGSGGGLPGLVIAIFLPDLEVSCVDTVGKKAAFVRQCAAELEVRNLRSLHGRVEQLRELRGEYDVVASRAFSSLADLVRLSRPLLAPGGVWLAMKGRVPTAEIEALPADAEMFHVEPVHVPGLDAARCIVWMRPVAGAEA